MKICQWEIFSNVEDNQNSIGEIIWVINTMGNNQSQFFDRSCCRWAGTRHARLSRCYIIYTYNDNTHTTYNTSETVLPLTENRLPPEEINRGEN